MERTTAYAREELVAEIGSMFISCAAKIPQSEELFNNHASYVDGWLECIRNDSNAIFKAAADTNRAADYILTKAGVSAWLISKEGQQRGKITARHTKKAAIVAVMFYATNDYGLPIKDCESMTGCGYDRTNAGIGHILCIIPR